MLEDVRRAAKSGFSYILVAGLIVIFAFFFGVPADSCSGGAPGARAQVASVAGEDVYTDDLNIIYNQVYGTRDRGDEAQVQRQQALALKAYLIIELLAHKAREAGLRVSDQEFQEYMKDPFRNPEFLSAYGQNGTWDGQFYQRYVQNLLRVSLAEYEEFKREELLARKYLNMVDMQIGVLPQEVATLETLRNTKLNLEFVKFQPDQLANFVEVSDAQVQAFAAQNADKIKKYYEEHADQYSEPAQMEVRRIYLERGKEVDGKSAQQRFEAAKERLDAGEDFATVAGEINDALKEQQGFMKMTSVENMSQDIVQALEGADVGEVREVKNPNELMLVKLLDKKEAVDTPLAQVRDDIARTLLQEQKVDQLIGQLTDKIVAKAKQTGSLSEAVAALKPAAPAEDAEQGDAQPAADDEGAEQAPKTVWSAVSVGETGEFTLEGQDLSGMFGGQLPPGVSLGRSPWDQIPKIGQSRELAVDAFTKLTEENPLAEKAYSVKDGKVVVRLQSKIEPGEAKAEAGDEKVGEEEAGGDAETAKAELVNELRSEKLSDLVGQWQRLFQRRSQYGSSLTMDYGPWIERQFEAAVESGLIELEPNTPVAELINPNAPAPAQAIPGMPGAPGASGSPIEVSPSGGGTTGAPEKEPKTN